MCHQVTKICVLHNGVQKHPLNSKTIYLLYIDVQKCVLKMTKVSIVLCVYVQKPVLQVSKLYIDV